MPCLNLQLRKFQNYILYIRNKHSLQLKQISLIKILKIYLCMKKKPQYNLSSLAAIFDAIFVSRLSYKLITNTKVTFEPFYALKSLDFMQKSEFKFII